MKRFLKETWELWYWAMFCPSRLQRRINQWSLHRDSGDASFSDILLNPIGWKFIFQFLIVVSIFSIPLLITFTFNSNPSLWILSLVFIISTYGISCWFLPIGIHTPLILFLVYINFPKTVNESFLFGFQDVTSVQPSLRAVFLGGTVSSVILGLAIASVYLLLERRQYTYAQRIAVGGSTTAISVGVWISSQSDVLTFFSCISSFLLLYLLRNSVNIRENLTGLTLGIAAVIAAVIAAGITINMIDVITLDTTSIFTIMFMFAFMSSLALGIVLLITASIAGIILLCCASIIFFGIFFGTFFSIVFGALFSVALSSMGVIAFYLASSFTGAIALIVEFIATNLSTLPLPIFLLLVSLISFSFSYSYQRLIGLGIGLTFAALGYEKLSWLSFLALPVAISFYYRFIPEYILFTPLSFLLRQQPKNVTDQSHRNWLKRFPPFSSELVWFAIPAHNELLAEVFKSERKLGVKTLQKMRISPLPGFNETATKALPLIISDYLADFEYIEDFNQLLPNTDNVAASQLLKTLIPSFYISKETNLDSKNFLSDSELAIILPQLRGIAQDADAALQANNFAIKERGLETIVRRLERLPSQLPGLGVNARALKRWTPVIQRWQRIVRYDLAQQKKLSQGELLNPFQYGNPLHRNRTDLFKGRQTFAENIARILLDRNRPTIILHGPRRCGKTSFLYNLPRLLPSDWIPIFVDAQSSATTTDEPSFCETLVRAIIRDGRSQGLKFPPRPNRNEFKSAPYVTLENWLTDAFDNFPEQDKDKRLLLTIDEFEKIGSAIEEHKITTALFDQLRSLIQHWDQLGFIFSGVQTLDELGPNWSSYFISVIPVEMLYLEPNEARELLTNPDPEFSLTYAPGLIDEVLQLTACHPNLLQLIGAALVTEANERHTTTATVDMLQAAISRAFTLGTSYFTNVWTEFTGNPRHPAEVQQGQILLKALAEGHQPNPDADPLTKSALRRMERYHVLNKIDDQYTFDIPLIQRWVKERAILDD